MIPAVPHIAAMAAYALADLSAPEGRRLISLSQNESLRGPSPAAIEAAQAAAAQPQVLQGNMQVGDMMSIIQQQTQQSQQQPQQLQGPVASLAGFHQQLDVRRADMHHVHGLQAITGELMVV